ncbi:HepT-like ribonuclease domain-containing protein [Prochlorothrix hollandica]|uniref:DUF86 domain-containing protein n=1 Tax=Prochlorothrix hollandica PCC 9006 = CALU 1027 TaxID=317619 RepID=A0A0M2Q165_PROHO|nr:DUF86 domain-containing protein [Prochlorothrix hollandica]KKJ00704.1 hypothetical protein PROH_05310 [Prochlorothrix hollandica PCC 9006 = CALU 1027]
MPDPNLTLQLLMQIDEAMQRIHWRFENIQTPEDFTRDRSGLDRLDAIAMMLIALGETIKRLDTHLGNRLSDLYPEIDWTAIKGIRNVLAHNYFSIDPEEVYKICSTDLQALANTLTQLRSQF